jgi:hypothetical protein
MLGVVRDDLKQLVVAEAQKQIDAKKQSIGNDGLDQAIFELKDKNGCHFATPHGKWWCRSQC